MNPLIVMGAALFVCALLFVFFLLASCLAVLIFRFAPTLEGTILSLTPSDVLQLLRGLPTYPVWLRSRKNPPPEQIEVLIVINPVSKAQYLNGFNPLHRPMFSPNRSDGMRFDFQDLFALKTLFIKLEDEGQYPILVPADLAMFRASGRRFRRPTHIVLGPAPPLELPIVRHKPRARIEPVSAFLHRTRKAS